MTPEQEHDDQDALISTLEQRALELVGLLPPKERRAVRCYYLQGLPLRETGRRLGLTREAAHLLIGRALWRIRHRLGSNDAETIETLLKR